jgi:uncharacterized protein YbcI
MQSGIPGAAAGLDENDAIAIAEMIRGTYREVFGVAPDSVEVSGDEAVVVAVLRGVFDETERSLIAAGRFRDVRSSRWAHREEMEPILRAGVEAPLDAEVHSFSAEVGEDDLVVITFVLDQEFLSAAELWHEG